MLSNGRGEGNSRDDGGAFHEYFSIIMIHEYRVTRDRFSSGIRTSSTRESSCDPLDVFPFFDVMTVGGSEAGL